MKSSFQPKGGRLPQKKHRINQEIKSPEVRLIGSDGIPIGVKPLRDALRMAELKNLDLVEIVSNSVPPVCRIIDYGKFVYEVRKKEKTQKKTQVQQLQKEIRFKWRTDTHDFNFKVKHARTFLEEGNKVKAIVTFRGREITHSEIGRDLLEKFTAALKDISKIDQNYRLDIRSMSVILAPTKPQKKTSTKPESEPTKDDKEKSTAIPTQESPNDNSNNDHNLNNESDLNNEPIPLEFLDDVPDIDSNVDSNPKDTNATELF